MAAIEDLLSPPIVSNTPVREGDPLELKLEFGGGMDLLFDKQRSHKVHVPSSSPDGRPANIDFLIHWIRDNLLKERVELFMEGDTIRPGILILINDTDWELEDEGSYILESGDEIVFISTLHGG